MLHKTIMIMVEKFNCKSVGKYLPKCFNLVIIQVLKLILEKLGVIFTFPQ